MSIFRRQSMLGGEADRGPQRYKIRITTGDGRVLYWHKRGQLHIVDEDVARVFVANFRPEVFAVQPDGAFIPVARGAEGNVRRVDMETV